MSNFKFGQVKEATPEPSPEKKVILHDKTNYVIGEGQGASKKVFKSTELVESDSSDDEDKKVFKSTELVESDSSDDEDKKRYDDEVDAYSIEHPDEVKVVNIYRSNSSIHATVEEKRRYTDEAKAINASKRPLKLKKKTGYILFLKDELPTLSVEEKKTYSTIVSQRWKQLQADDADRVAEYNTAAKAHNDTLERAATTILRNILIMFALMQLINYLH